MYFVSKKELTAFPLDVLFNQVSEAGNNAVEHILKQAREVHDRAVERRIEALYANSQESYEGNPEDEFPFSPPDGDYVQKERLEARKEAFKLFAEKYDLKGNAAWLLPQLTAHIARMSTCGGNTLEYVDQFGQDDFHKGIFTIAKHPLRGDIIAKQYSADARNYSALVPLLLMPHKKFNGMKYSQWSREGLHKAVDTNLYEAMTLEFAPENTVEELLTIRQHGLTVATGKSAGSVKSAVSTHRLNFLTGDLKKIPWLAHVMLFQIWCAHPVNRTDLMILDWKDWDSMPKPLIEANPVVTQGISASKQFKFTPGSWSDD